MEYLGLLAFEDPIKATATAALQQAKYLGIDIRILTGDTVEVAFGVAKKIGMNIQEDDVVSGDILSTTSETDKHDLISKTKIFARVDPKEKYEILQVLAHRHSVMFLGEGINDAPALKRADVGMVVQEASDIAKEAADILLTKPDLSVIVESINFGRQIMDNISKYILVTLTGNFGSLYAISLLSVISPIIPLLPAQILLENILTDVPMIGLVNASGERERRPAKQNIRQIAFYSIILGIAILLMQFIFYRMFIHLPTDLFRTMWFIEVVLLEFILIVSLHTREWFWRARIFTTTTTLFFIGVVAFTVALPFIPSMSGWFHLVPYSLNLFLPVLGIVLLGLFIVEMMKKFLFQKNEIS